MEKPISIPFSLYSNFVVEERNRETSGSGPIGWVEGPNENARCLSGFKVASSLQIDPLDVGVMRTLYYRLHWKHVDSSCAP